MLGNFEENLANGKINIKYFQESTMESLFRVMSDWQSLYHRDFMSTEIHQDRGLFCCIAILKPLADSTLYKVSLRDNEGECFMVDKHEDGGVSRLAVSVYNANFEGEPIITEKFRGRGDGKKLIDYF